MKTVMMVSSSGGHWLQLIKLSPPFKEWRQVYITTDGKYKNSVNGHEFRLVPDASRWSKFRLIWLALVMLYLICKVRPDVVVSTGAAPGFFAIVIAKKFKAKTIWVDSVANVESMSMSGLNVGKYADLWLTQWEHIARPDGPQFKGSVF